jgi:hypothetical protein
MNSSTTTARGGGPCRGQRHAKLPLVDGLNWKSDPAYKRCRGGAQQLRANVRTNAHRRQASGHEKAKRDCRIEVRTGYAAERADGDGQRQPMCERDADDAGAGPDGGCGAQDGGDAGETEIESTEEFGKERLNFHSAILAKKRAGPSTHSRGASLQQRRDRNDRSR